MRARARTVGCITRAPCRVAVALLAFSFATADDGGYAVYSDWRGWARLQRDTHAVLASSYDRSGGNDDFSQYEDPPGLIREEIVCTVATLEGPGIVRRFWMPHLTADRGFVVRMFFDGEDTPRIDTTSDVLFRGEFAYFAAPLVDTFAGGQVCYEPIPFTDALRIETVNKKLPDGDEFSANRHYYQYGCTRLPAGAPIESFNASLSEDEHSARQAAVRVFENPGEHPAGDDPESIRVTTDPVALAGGQTLVIAELAGPGLVRRFHVKLDEPGDDELANLGLRVFYDEEADAAIDCDIGNLFGAGRGRAVYRSVPLGTESPDGFYCFWPMPFHRAVRFELYNTGDETVEVAGALVEYVSAAIDNDECYLHAAVNAETREPGQILHPVLSREGRGHFVGTLLYVEQEADSFFLLEGDDIIRVDEDAEVLYGTGLEDAFNGGYYYNWVAGQEDEPEGLKPRSAIRSFNGILFVDRQSDPPLVRADQYRWRIADPVPFTRSIDVAIENRYAVSGSKWTSVAFWYEQPPLLADLDCSGAVDFDDIDPFVLALVDPDGYTQQYPDCDVTLADINRDASIDFDDIDPFVECLINNGCP
jgi:hypothetical protein